MGVRYSYPRNRFAALRWGCPRGQLKPMGVGAAAPPPRPALPAADVGARQLHGYWRRGRDSNPRYGYPYAAFRVRCFQPLSHLSVAAMTYVSFSALAKGFPRGGAVPERRQGNRTATGE